jgi:hypothetical protein
MKLEVVRALSRLPSWGLFFTCVSLLAVRHPAHFARRPAQLSSLTFSSADLDAVTFVTRPWPITTDLSLERHKLSLSSYLCCSRRAALVLLFATNTTRQAALLAFLREHFGPSRVRACTGRLKVDANGVPFVYELFSYGLQLARTALVCFIDSGVLVDPAWYRAVLATFAAHPTASPHLTGQRIEVAVPPAFAARPASFWADVRRLVRESAVWCFEEIGSSYFVWPADSPPMSFNDFPWFKFGGYFWEMWLNGALDMQARVISLRRKIPVYYVGVGREDRGTGPTAWNARIVRSKGVKITPRHTELMNHYDLPSFEGITPLAAAPVCIANESVPVVQL